jgi:hypothetical protein
MRINFISGNTVIGAVYDEFNLTSDDWVGRSPNWIYKALRLLNNRNVEVDYYIKGNFENNRILLPEFDGAIKMLSVNSKVLINTDNISITTNNATIESDDTIVSTDDTFNVNNALSKDEMLLTSNSTAINSLTENQYFIRRGILYTSEVSGTYKLWYRAIPVEFNDKHQTYIPFIPDIEKVIDVLKWYIFKNILSRGYIHPIYSLGSKDPEYDPNKKFQASLKGARIALDECDFNDRNNLANISMAFFTIPSYSTGQVYNLFELYKDNAV